MAPVRELNTLFLTFNCGREAINTDYFAASVARTLTNELPPDLVVLSLQEIAPISYSFLGGSFLSPYLDRFALAVNRAAQSWGNGKGRYEQLLGSNIGMTAIILLARPEVAANINWIETGGTGVGYMEMGNKGAVGARIGYAVGQGEEMVLTFVAAHLAPMEENVHRRNQDWKKINENLVFGQLPQVVDARTKAIKDPAEETEPLLSSATDGGPEHTASGIHTLISSTSHTFFGGDLNYRTSDIKPHPEDHLSWPKPEDDPSDSQHFSHLLDRDQLSREREAGRTLHYLTEAPITFPPTYKYSSEAQDQARRMASSLAFRRHGPKTQTPTQTDWLWAEHRCPSWCDRVLYLNPPFEGTQPQIQSYVSLPLQPTSDHQPVALSFSIPLKPLPRDQTEPWVSSPFKIRPDWEVYRTAARRKEVLVGAVAYLTWTWEGEAMLFGTIIAIIGAWAALRSLF